MKKDRLKAYARYGAAILVPAVIAFLSTMQITAVYINDQIADDYGSQTINLKKSFKRSFDKKVSKEISVRPKSLREALSLLGINGQIPNLNIVVQKRDRLFRLYSGEREIISYKIGLGPSPTGRKESEGDGKTPEGQYEVVDKNSEDLSAKIGSRWIHINYPNNIDAAVSLNAGRISKYDHDQILRANRRKVVPPQSTILGGGIGIHGASGLNVTTRGCIGLTNKDIEEIYNYVKIGTPIIIKP